MSIALPALNLASQLAPMLLQRSQGAQGAAQNGGLGGIGKLLQSVGQVLGAVAPLLQSLGGANPLSAALSRGIPSPAANPFSQGAPSAGGAPAGASGSPFGGLSQVLDLAASATGVASSALDLANVVQQRRGAAAGRTPGAGRR